jgi:hypothetical protein
MPFKKGQSGNPTGHRKVRSEVERNLELSARHLTDASLKTLERNLQCGVPAAEVSAAREILDRAWGKARQSIDKTVTHLVADDRISVVRTELREKASQRLQLQ